MAEAVAQYNITQDNLGYEFLDEVKRTLKRIFEYPRAWPSISSRMRRCQVNRFPYGVIYRVSHDMILVVSVMHLHSDPETWKCRASSTGRNERGG